MVPSCHYGWVQGSWSTDIGYVSYYSITISSSSMLACQPLCVLPQFLFYPVQALFNSGKWSQQIIRVVDSATAYLIFSIYLSLLCVLVFSQAFAVWPLLSWVWISPQDPLTWTLWVHLWLSISSPQWHSWSYAGVHSPLNCQSYFARSYIVSVDLML